MNLDSQVLLNLTAEVLYDLLIKCFTHIGFVVVNPYIWALKMLTVSQKKNWIIQAHAEVPDSLEPLELSKDVPKHHRDE
jgi:hypothetical protein